MGGIKSLRLDLKNKGDFYEATTTSCKIRTDRNNVQIRVSVPSNIQLLIGYGEKVCHSALLFHNKFEVITLSSNKRAEYPLLLVHALASSQHGTKIICLFISSMKEVESEFVRIIGKITALESTSPQESVVGVCHMESVINETLGKEFDWQMPLHYTRQQAINQAQIMNCKRFVMRAEEVLGLTSDQSFWCKFVMFCQELLNEKIDIDPQWKQNIATNPREEAKNYACNIF